MNFFDQQAQARRTSRRLLWLFSLSLVLLVVLVNLGFFLLWQWSAFRYGGGHGKAVVLAYLHSYFCLAVSIATLVAFAAGSVKRYLQLQRSPTALADLVGATEITPTTAASDEKQLINICEEMAVAAGLPMPRLFVMRNEPGINAFVTGIYPEQLLVVTQGALDQLDRDELQGVIGHEFSHLFNGDTLLNMRMLVVLAGLLSVSRIGRYLIATSLPRKDLESRRQFRKQLGIEDSNRTRNNASLLFIVGVILFLAGYAGLFFGRLIKAAVSRQREALADASAIQFTRHPEGLAGALIKIRNGQTTLLNHRFAEDINHMCFGDAVVIRWRRLLATHPDIDTRLTNIDPSWLARARVRERRQQEKPDQPTVSSPALGYAQSLVASIPEALMQQLHTPDGASLVIYALLMNVGYQRFLPAVAEADKHRLPLLAEQIDQLGSRIRLPLADLALPALQRLDEPSHKRLLDNVDWLIKSDGQVTLFEFLLRQLVRERLLPRPAEKTSYSRLETLAGQIQLLLSMLIHQASQEPAVQQTLFRRFATSLLPPGRVLLPLEKCSLVALAHALKEIRRLSPLQKKSLLDCCADIVMADQLVQVGEAELLRLVSTLIDCPMPPLTKA